MYIKGFSLLELMVVIAIVGLLSSVAAPSYSTYSSKAKLAGVYPLMQNQMSYVVENYSLGSTTVKTMSSPMTGVTSITATPTSTGGTVAVLFVDGSDISTAFDDAAVTLTFTGAVSNGIMSWSSCQISGASVSASNQDRIEEFLSNFSCTTSWT